MEFRWDGPQQVKNLGDDPPKSAINALFAIPGNTKTDSSLPHHDVSGDGSVGAADKDGCIAAISALNGARGGVSASQAEKNKAYSHLASHLRAMGVTPPAKQFAAPQLTERRAWCQSLRGIPERIDMALGGGNVEMRAKANGTGGTKFQFDGYATVFDHPFDMWDPWGDQFTEMVNQGAATRTLANNCDVPFLIGHDAGGFSLARTKSGTMQLGQDTHGVYVHAPDLDGSLEMVRQLASAVERGDMDEMSLAFIALGQQWSPDWMQRNITEMDLHKGDVSVVVFGANDGTAGSSMTALPFDSLTLRRPAALRNSSRLLRAAALHAPLSGAHSHPHSAYGDQGGDDTHSHLHVHNNDADHAHSHDQLAAGHPHEHLDGGGYPDSSSPDYDPQVNGLPMVQCPYGTSNGCGVMNPGGNRFCGGCGGPLYSEDGTIIVDDNGVISENEGDVSSVQSTARAAAELELRRRQLALLALTS